MESPTQVLPSLMQRHVSQPDSPVNDAASDSFHIPDVLRNATSKKQKKSVAALQVFTEQIRLLSGRIKTAVPAPASVSASSLTKKQKGALLPSLLALKARLELEREICLSAALRRMDVAADVAPKATTKAAPPTPPFPTAPSPPKAKTPILNESTPSTSAVPATLPHSPFVIPEILKTAEYPKKQHRLATLERFAQELSVVVLQINAVTSGTVLRHPTTGKLLTVQRLRKMRAAVEESINSCAYAAFRGAKLPHLASGFLFAAPRS